MSFSPATLVTAKDTTLILTCYSLGCFASGYYWARWRSGRDIRQFGSGSTGARNVGRLLGPSGFLVVLLLDLTKGALAVGLAAHLRASPEAMIAAMLAVAAGHTWPAQLRFQGGKGVATSLGALLAYDALIACVLLAVFLPLWAVARSFTLGGLLAFTLTPLILLLWGFGNPAVAATSFLAILVHVAHRKNWREEFARLFPDRPLKELAERADKTNEHEA